MVKDSEIFKINISLTDHDFFISKIYKDVKEKIDKLGYVFFENEQSTKPKKYGDEIKFNFSAVKEFDDFMIGKINIDFSFSNVKRSKIGDHGDVEIGINAIRTVDFKNRWGKDPFNRFLFRLYSSIKKIEWKKQYTLPLSDDASEIYNLIKESLELEVS